MPNTFYIDYVNGNDGWAGDSFAAGHPWKTITLGATAARIAPGDTIRIAKSPAPIKLSGDTGHATWTHKSKTVTLIESQIANIDMCETAWTGAGDTTITRTAVGTDGKEGSYCMKLAVDASPQTNILQAYFATGELNLAAYQKISFWFKNQAAIVANNWIACLCSDTAGATPVDSFLIPAIAGLGYWIPLTLTKVGGGNLGASIKSIAIYSGATAPTASKYIYVDNFVACTTSGLNLQSLISKNSLEQGGTEGWYGIQSINGTTVLLDNHTSNKGNAGRGYSTLGTSPETVDTYFRETIKTDYAAVYNTVVQQVMDSGTLGNNIEFQGGYNIATNEQDGETFFDGLSGEGYGLQIDGKNYIVIDHISLSRYYYNFNGSGASLGCDITFLNISNAQIGVYITFTTANDITIVNCNNNNTQGLYLTLSFCTLSITNCNNNLGPGFYSTGTHNTITLINYALNNSTYGIYFFNAAHFNIVSTIGYADDNASYGIYILSNWNRINLIQSASRNDTYGIYIGAIGNQINRILAANDNTSSGLRIENNFNYIGYISTSGNTTRGVYTGTGVNYIGTAVCAEANKIVNGFSSASGYQDNRLYVNNLGGYVYSSCEYSNWVTQEATAGGTGLEWKISPTNILRTDHWPVFVSLAKIAVIADKLVTVEAYFKLSHATDIGAKLVCLGGQLTGMNNDEVATCPEDTNRNQLTITFTPTEIGVVEIEGWVYWRANTADENVIIDDIEITQAD